MVDLQMYKPFQVSSKVNGTYSVEFTGELGMHLQRTAAAINAIFVVDRVIARLFFVEIDQLAEKTKVIFIDCNEQNKTIDYAQDVIRQLIAQNVRKDSVLVAVGGGITQDIVAFISSILFRGVQWQFYPTTLLSQCDSCIGSKSSINLDQFKNLLGTFNPPSRIYVYPGFLETLSQSEICSGIGEMLHYFLTDGIELAEQIGEQYDDILTNRDKLAYFINNSLRIKKKIIEIDEFDTSIRHIFNYGHTFGHAIEAVTNYAIPHGQAVSIGMDMANYISVRKGILTQADFDRMHVVLQKNFSSFKVTEDNLDAYCSALSKDKKNKGTKLGAILSRAPGNVEKIFVDIDDSFKKILLDYSKRYGS
jgi:3-dehydroquinate synthase